MAAATKETMAFRWKVLEEHCSPGEFAVAGDGFNVRVRADREHLVLMVFPPDKLSDPVIGMEVAWREAGKPELASPPAFTFDAGGPYAFIEAHGIVVRVRVDGTGVTTEVASATAGEDETLRSAFASWQDLAFASEEVGIIADLQDLYRRLLG